ncbi:DUF5687 family protein [Salinibacter sp.]|uniref:DUF5687 family protein n=1 Tax=Salinibacter sp. TaxID=2065818 RepID=UPI0021E8EFF8|nr:DUF5687 family protein [Salinibacter sp.]
MTLLDALRHQWHQRTRSPTWGRSLIGTLLLLLAAGYFGVLFVALGWFYPEIVAEVAPGQDPLRLLNGFLLYGAVGLVPARFFLQRSAGTDVRPYLPLFLRRARVVRILQVLSSLSLLNLLPVIVLTALWGSTVFLATSAVGATYWAVGALLLVATTQFLNSLLRAVWDWNAGLVLGAAGLVAVLVVGSNWMRTGVLRAASAWCFGGLAAGRILPLIVMLAGTAALAVAAHRMLRGRLYSVLWDADSPRTQSTGVLQGVGHGRGRVVSLALLDLKLILRNKRPRQMLGAGLLVIGPFLLILLLGEKIPPMNEVIFGFLLSGHLGLTYTQFGYAWHGTHFDGLLARAVAPRLLVQAQFVTFVGLCMAPLMLIVPVIAAVRPQLLASLGSFFCTTPGSLPLCSLSSERGAARP